MSPDRYIVNHEGDEERPKIKKSEAKEDMAKMN